MFKFDPTILPHLAAIESDKERQNRLRAKAHAGYISGLERKAAMYKRINILVTAYAVAVTLVLFFRSIPV